MAKVSVLGVAIAVLLLGVWVVAVSPATSPAPVAAATPVDPVHGRAIFEQTSLHGTPGCVTCHSLEPGFKVVGPSLAGVGARARLLLHSGYHGLATTPAELIREAILTRQPGLWGGSTHFVLPEWDGVLERQEVIDLAAFLASLN